MRALVHLYCGDGKGKTTAAVGLTVRAAGAGKRVLFTQFFKPGNSSEIAVLRTLPNVTTCHADTVQGFFRSMSPAQRAQAARDYTALLRDVLARAAEFDLLVLDEAVSACNHGVIPEAELLDFLDRRPETTEVVLTGREPSEALLARADYVTEMCKRRHPFDAGVAARRGIEF
jgi:cob(I)alamin adenosyltransferase